jgi:hypothetical protein
LFQCLLACNQFLTSQCAAKFPFSILPGCLIMKYASLALCALCSVVGLTSAMRAEAGGHSIRIDEGNGAGCMTNWTAVIDATALSAISPGGTYSSAVACTPNSNSPDDLFRNGTGANDAATAIGGGSAFAATGGEMFQFYAGAVGPQPDAQVVAWSLANSDTEIEMNGWCPGGAAGSLTWGSSTYKGGCSGAATDFLFSSTKAFIGYVVDSVQSDGTLLGTVTLSSTLPTGWSASGGTVSAPEIDPASAISAMTLLLGCLAVMRGDRRLAVPPVFR